MRLSGVWKVGEGELRLRFGSGAAAWAVVFHRVSVWPLSQPVGHSVTQWLHCQAALRGLGSGVGHRKDQAHIVSLRYIRFRERGRPL